MCVGGGRSGRMAGRTPFGAGPLPFADRVPSRRDRVPTTSTDGSPVVKAELEYPNPVAVKIKLMRLGKMRAPYYRIVVADSRTKRDGQSIEEIGKYHPKEDPSFIEVKADRAAYWLSVGAQPTEAVTAILKVSGDWQKFKGLPAPPPMLVAKPKADKRVAFEVAAKEGAGTAPTTDATTPKSRKAPAKKTADPSSPESSDAAAVAVEAEEAAGGVESITAVESGESVAPKGEVNADNQRAKSPAERLGLLDPARLQAGVGEEVQCGSCPDRIAPGPAQLQALPGPGHGGCGLVGQSELRAADQGRAAHQVGQPGLADGEEAAEPVGTLGERAAGDPAGPDRGADPQAGFRVAIRQASAQHLTEISDIGVVPAKHVYHR